METIYAGLIQVRLSGFQLTALSLAPLLLGLVYWVLRDRDRLVSVTAVSVGDAAHANVRGDDTLVPLRHDRLLFSRSRTRRRSDGVERLVRLRNGQQAWIDNTKITDTGY